MDRRGIVREYSQKSGGNLIRTNPYQSCGFMPLSDISELFETSTHDLTGDFLPEDEFGFSETDLCGKRAMGDMLVVEHPNDFAQRAISSLRSENLDGAIDPYDSEIVTESTEKISLDLSSAGIDNEYIRKYDEWLIGFVYQYRSEVAVADGEIDESHVPFVLFNPRESEGMRRGKKRGELSSIKRRYCHSRSHGKRGGKRQKFHQRSTKVIF